MTIRFKDKNGNYITRPKNYSATDYQVKVAINERFENGDLALPVKALDFIATIEEESETIYTPITNNSTNSKYGSTISIDEFKSIIDRSTFFSTPYCSNVAEDSEMYNFMQLYGSNMQCNADGLSAGEYLFYRPAYVIGTTQYSYQLYYFQSEYATIEEIIDSGNLPTPTLLTTNTVVEAGEDTPWYASYPKYSLEMSQLTVDSGKYGYLFIHGASGGDYTLNTGFLPYMHLSKVVLNDPISYTETTPVSFLEKEIYYSFGNTNAGKRLLEGLRKTLNIASVGASGYPINTYGKTYVVGGDSGTAYGATEIETAISERCGAVGKVISKGGASFTNTSIVGSGIEFVNTYHSIGYPDIVCLCWGGNNDSGGVGTIDADYMEDGQTAPTTTLGGLRYIVEDIRTVSPNTCIIGWIGYQSAEGITENEAKRERWDLIREAYKTLSIPVIDAWGESGIVPRYMMAYDGGGIGGDASHPSDPYGRTRVAKLIANAMIRYA